MNGFQTKQDETEVLVVGAGPVGLMAASELARRGVALRIVERATVRSPLSKALVVQPRTLETMDLIGLADEFVRRGYPAPGLNVGLGSGGKSVCVELRDLDTRFPYLLVLPQKETEDILEARLAEHGVAIERGVEFVGLEQSDDECVVSRVRLPDGGEERIRSRYLIGCDGAHSSVRHAIGLPFEGVNYDSVVFLADVKIEGEEEFVKSRITNFTSRRGFVSVLPFLGECSRIFAVDFAKQHRNPDEELTLPELQETVDAIAPIKLKLRDPRWLTRFYAPSRLVPTNRKGRVFLVGDAFLGAAREGDFGALLATLDPDVVLRSDGGLLRPGLSRKVRGARGVAEGALTFSRIAPFAQPALVNGAAGVVVVRRGRPISVMGFAVKGGKIVEIDVLADPERLNRLDLTFLDH